MTVGEDLEQKDDVASLNLATFPALQERILQGMDARGASDDGGSADGVGAACGLAVLSGAGAGGGEGGAAAEVPTVLAVAYRSCMVDLVLVPLALSPK